MWLISHQPFSGPRRSYAPHDSHTIRSAALGGRETEPHPPARRRYTPQAPVGAYGSSDQRGGPVPSQPGEPFAERVSFERPKLLDCVLICEQPALFGVEVLGRGGRALAEDRTSTRLNSSH